MSLSGVNASATGFNVSVPRSVSAFTGVGAPVASYNVSAPPGISTPATRFNISVPYRGVSAPTTDSNVRQPTGVGAFPHISAPVPGINVSVPVPGINVSAPVPSINVSAPVPSINVSAAVSGFNVSAPMPSINVGAPVPSINVSAPVPSNNVSAPPGFSTYSGVSAPITSFNAGTSSNVGAPPPGMNIYAQPYTAASAYPMYQPQTIAPTSQSSSSMVHDLAAVLTLPQPQMPKFSGDCTDYNSFSIAFDSRIASRISSNIDKLYYLNQYLEGEPKNLIGGCLLMSVENGYDAARALLKKEYGDPYKVSNAYLNKVLKWAVMKHDNVSALKQFSIFLTRCMYAMSSSAHMHVLNHAPNMQIIVQKLPSYLQNKWCDKASYFRTEQHRMPQFADLTLFIEKAVDVATDPIFGRAALYEKGETQKHRTSTTPNKKKHIFAGATGANTVNDRTVRTDVNTKINRPSQQCALCRKPHDLDSCTDFLKKDLAARRQFLMDGRMCFGCYGYNHRSKGCMRKRICATCSRRHPTALHDEKFQFPAKTNNTSVAATGIDVTNCSATSTNSSVIMHAIIPVNVQKKGDNTSLTTYAFYDNGSNSCFISEELVDDLQLTGQSSRLKLKTMHGQSYIDTSSITDLVVADLSNNNSISLPKTFSRKEIPVDHDQIPRPETLARCPHLLPISNLIPPYQPDLKIGLLIGNNCAPAMEPLEVIPSTGNGPFAVRLRHGWTIHGPLRVDVDDRSGNVSCGRVSLQPTTHTDETVSPNALLKVFEADFIEHQKPNHPDERGPSPDDIQFIRKAENIQQAPDGHFTLSMPFRDNVIMPNNRAQAVQRAEWQRKKLLRNEKYYRDYVTFMNTIIIKGYAEKVPADRTATTVWYLPHHGIYHPKKPEKIRVVFDASAKYHNISLNDMLIQGPDLTNSIVGVLTRFRQGNIAFIADIEAMFYQVKVPDEQFDFLRFLWWPNGDLNADMEEYHMKVHLFGAVCSPSIANYALRHIAYTIPDDTLLHPAIKETILKNFYVDDCLRSVDSEESAIRLITDLKSTCASGGFNLTKFTCNNNNVMKTIPRVEHSKQMQTRSLDCDELPTEHALGMQWHVDSDVFGFSVTLKNMQSYTRRGILSTVSAVYDPLGFIAPFILPAKQILQDLCRDEDLRWDDPVPQQYRDRFCQWLNELPEIQDITIPRCLKPDDYGDIVSSQMHVFCDASFNGYGVVAYLRLYDGEQVHTSFLMGKSRLASIKPITIPRLELVAATVGVRIGCLLFNELADGVRIDSIIYHTDSTTVLHYIYSKKRRFPIFVANRIQLIHNFSETSQWRYVPTKENPADDASRGLDIQKMKQTHWLTGPDFLRLPESKWPSQPELTPSADLEVMSTVTSSEESFTNNLIRQYSSWHRLKKAVAVYLTVQSILRERRARRLDPSVVMTEKYEPFNTRMLNRAENAILHHVQRESFNSEILILSQQSSEGKRGRGATHTNLPRSSPIYRLDPIMDHNLLRVGGRLDKSDLPEGTKHPILLPRKSHITILIIRDVHERLAHSGRNHTMAQIRTKFWIIGLNSAVRQYICRCVGCRRERKPVNEQKMADLPVDRMTPAPPFTYTGVDFFGPILIKEGRKEMKRYGALYTCLVSRAVHIEIAVSLETDSFLNSLRRFIARRGPIKELRCDNGTNFVGAERELRQAVLEMNNDHLREQLLKESITWKFNPPAASHMGGVWERQIRSVRKVLSPMLREHGDRLDDESLRTLMCEIEAVINSRPLTFVSNDPNDDAPLTPNHILHMKPVMLPPPGNFQKEDVYLRRRWRRVQYLTNLFWSRWRREYLVTLQERQKWNNPKRNVQVGDVVLVKDDNVPRFSWPLGRVINTEPDKKGFVRSTTVRTRGTELRRPVDRLVLLVPVEEQSHD